MIRAVVPLVLAFAACAAIACPGADKAHDAKANSESTVASALSNVRQQSRAEAEKKVVKPVDSKKPTS